MRKIDPKSIGIFLGLTIPTITVAFNVSNKIIDWLNPSDSILFFKISLGIIASYSGIVLAYRLFLFFRPLQIGYYKPDSREQSIYNIYILFYLLFFNPFLPPLLVPSPLMRIFYQLLGVKFGDNSYTAGAILDPPLVKVGSNCILGYDSVVCPHAVEGDSVFFAPIEIGNNVTIGMRSILMAGVKVEDNAIVAAGAIVLKNTLIKNGEVWAGAPAKKIREGGAQAQLPNRLCS